MLFVILSIVSNIEFLFFYFFGLDILDKIYLTCKISKFANIKKSFFIALLLFVFIFFIYLIFYKPSDLVMR